MARTRKKCHVNCHRLLFLFIIAMGLFSRPGYALTDQNNPQPQADDLILPMPNGKSMAFRPVCIGKGGGSYAWKQIRLGDVSGGYKETPVSVALGGAFPMEENSSEDWCYFIGKYEVTEDQLYTLLQSRTDRSESLYPAQEVTWFEVQNFIQQYNAWLYENAAEKIPEYGEVPGYIRLPTEAEWEFAARGGSKVSAAKFDRKTPYPRKKIAEYEWFSGPTSSHNKLKKTGQLKANPLGLHDMLGNVMEMTRSLYQIEYNQGRSGGFTARGGHYLTGGKQLRSSLRTEQPFYFLDPESKQIHPAGHKTLGFRLVISSLVFPNRQIGRKLKEEWPSYHKSNAQELPAAVSTSAVSNQTRIAGTEAAIQLQSIKNELHVSGNLSDEMALRMDNLAASLDRIQFIVRQAQKDSAFAWMKIAGQQAYFIYTESRKLPSLKELQKSAQSFQREKTYRAYLLREKEIIANMQKTITSYTESIRQLGASDSQAIEASITAYASFLDKNNASPEQKKIIALIRNHIAAYIKTGRTDDNRWKADLVWKHTNQ